ncbi:MAG: type I-E CRISPR-associated protein Cse1/CasA [Frankia sp.]|nr:type I-E CRISPR-associated protein Cse1/CasA [Frankia sp.]
MASFDLRDEPWVPLMRQGRRVEVGVREALLDADAFDGLALDDPLEAVAVFRQVLLPVVVDALGPPRNEDEWASLRNAGRFDGDRIGGYLDGHADKFDLFDAKRPFAQVAGLRTDNDKTKPVSLLIPRLASGNNVPLFSARTENDPPALSPAAAARALLAAHCWDTAAIKSGAVGDPRMSSGKTTGNPTGPLGQLGVILPAGASLFETILLNLPIMPLGLRPLDRPQWRSADAATPAWSEREPYGLLDLLTWQSRRIRLIPSPDSTAADGVVVRQVVLAAGDRLLGSVHDLEPHSAWRRVEKPRANEPPSRAVRHQPGRAAWRGLEALLATSQPTSEGVTAPPLLSQLARLRARGRVPADLPLRVLTVGVRYGNQSAVIEDVMVDEIPLPVVALVADSAVRETVLAVADQAERLRLAANTLGDELRAAGGGDKVPWDRSQRLGDALVYALTPAVRRLLAGLARHPEEAERAEDAWAVVARRLAWEVAEPVLSGAGPGTFLGRHPEQKFAPRLATAEISFRRALNDILGPVPAAPAAS